MLSAELYLRRFPFDRESLAVIVQPALTPARPNQDPIDFARDNYATEINPEAFLSPWEIRSISYTRRPVPSNLIGAAVPQARFTIEVKRRAGFYIWQVFVPMLLMVVVPWTAFWVKLGEFDWQMKIPLGIMLAMIAFEFALARDLPRIGYITFFDAIMLISFSFTFLTIMEIITTHALILRGNTRLAEKIQRHARWVVPLSYVVLIALMIPLFFAGSGRPD